jgi:hypothetical protein
VIEKEKKKEIEDLVQEVDLILVQGHLFIKEEETMIIRPSETDPTKERGIQHAMTKEVTEDQDHQN